MWAQNLFVRSRFVFAAAVAVDSAVDYFILKAKVINVALREIGRGRVSSVSLS